MTKVVIVGAGPAGLLLAHNLIKRPDYQIHVHESRPDPRQIAAEELRTYPIGLDRRGQRAIREIEGLEAALEKCGVWSVGACFRVGNKAQVIPQPPSLMVDRNNITLTMLRQLVQVVPASNSSIAFHFESTANDVDMGNNILVVESKNGHIDKVSYDRLVAADGARSKVRNCLAEKGEMGYEEKLIPDQYKSFYIPRTSTDGSIVLDSDMIHGWKVEDERVIMVPLQADSCSGVYIFPMGKDPFSGLKDAASVKQYFDIISPNSLAKFVTDSEAEQLRTRPVAGLLTVKCDRMHVGNDILLIGDAVHAVSASIGQGCNSSLEDTMVFVGYLDQYNDDWSKALPAFTAERLPDAHALRELSDYTLPRSKWMFVEFLIRQILKKILPSWLSKYMAPLPRELLSSTDLRYSEVLEKSKWWTDRVKLSAATSTNNGQT